MKLLIITFFLLFVLSAQESDSSGVEKITVKTPIAVLTLEGKGVTTQESEILSERLRWALVQDGRYQVVERTQMEIILEEQGFQQSGCLSNECLIQAGLILGVQQMVGGTVGKIGNSYAVDIRLFDVETSEIVKAVSRNHPGAIDGLLAVMGELAVELAHDQKMIPQNQSDANKHLTYQENPVTIIETLEKSISQVKSEFADNSQRNYSFFDGESWAPFQFSFAYPRQILPASVKIYGFRFNLIYGLNHSVYGLDIGLINELKYDLMGIQAGFSNQAKTVYGIQEGVLNTCENLYGLQAGFINKAHTTIGCQIGFINRSQFLTGVQIGLINYNPGGSGQPRLPIINIGF